MTLRPTLNFPNHSTIKLSQVSQTHNNPSLLALFPIQPAQPKEMNLILCNAVPQDVPPLFRALIATG